MSGYIHPEREPISREQLIAMIVALVAGVLMLFIALYASRVAVGWLATVGKIPVGAPVMFVLGSTLLIQSRSATADGEQVRTVRFRRLYAFFLYAMGAAMVALPFVLGGR